MAVWLVPALKAVLPHLGTIVTAVAPAFTRKKADASANQTQLLQDQIAELQSAAAQNAAHIKELALQLQNTVSALERAALIAEAKMKRTFRLAIAATALAIIGLFGAAFLILTQY
jgi:uncharacterized protein YlxW (UPF0749 family)